MRNEICHFLIIKEQDTTLLTVPLRIQDPCVPPVNQNKRKVFIERSDIVLKRTQYLRKVRQLRRERRPLIYLDETWVDCNITFSKWWQSQAVLGVVQRGNASQRIIVLYAGGDTGILPDTSLVYKENTTSGDYHGQMNSTIFEKWTSEKLITNLPPNAVLILYNASYHTVQVNKYPTKASRKEEISHWLLNKNVQFSPVLRKVELMELVKQNAPKEKSYKFDSMLEKHDFTALRLPPYHCDINAIEFVWGEIKQFVRNCNTTGDMVMNKLLIITKEALESVTMEEWKKYCTHVENVENDYWEKDGLIKDLSESLIISSDEDNVDMCSDCDTE
ncbi:uncharacterized protein LOC118196400 [Stegodyphus dumicola]|uniref:uncharacterized protein LOC118196400 n=1 Tax=Stegodyphus dumicola TaxID=202533 RepID=UPI0015B2105C|nr:uncharacterized protein LOC118196400 [Stegodyphus dumicola]